MTGQQEPDNAPTRSEILAACRNIQDGWSEKKERSRRGIKVKDDPYEFPMAKEAWLFPKNVVLRS